MSLIPARRFILFQNVLHVTSDFHNVDQICMAHVKMTRYWQVWNLYLR